MAAPLRFRFTAPLAWSLRQHFTVRVSTLLLAAPPLFALAFLVQPWMPRFAQAGIAWAQVNLGPGVLLVWFPAAVLSLAYFLGSLVKRNPQVQFLVEFALALGWHWFTGSR